MIRTRTTAVLALAASLAAGTALAQTSNSTTSTTTPAPGSTRTMPDSNGGAASPTLGAPTAGARNDAPSNRNPVLTNQNTVRASKVIGSSVYNDKDEKIGSIDDVILDKDHRATVAVLSVGGFLGLGSKLIEVPYQQLQFGDTRDNSENRVKLPNVSKESLQGLPEYSYSKG